MIHVSFSHEITSLQDLEKIAREDWKAAAIRFYQDEYNFDEKTPEEWEILKQGRSMLKKMCPDEFRTGVHLLGANRAFMGEDIYSINGNIASTLHCFHRECGKYKILNWSSMYCAHCMKDVSLDEVGRWDEDSTEPGSVKPQGTYSGEETSP